MPLYPVNLALQQVSFCQYSKQLKAAHVQSSMCENQSIPIYYLVIISVSPYTILFYNIENLDFDFDDSVVMFPLAFSPQTASFETLSFPFVINITDDNEFEGEECFTCSISSPSPDNLQFGNYPNKTICIRDNEGI